MSKTKPIVTDADAKSLETFGEALAAVGRDIQQSVVIPTDGDTLRLEWVLAGLARQEDAPRFEVIVIGDTTAEKSDALFALFQNIPIVIHSWFLPFKETEQEFRAGNARNLGIIHAKGEQIVFIDQDCVPDADFLSAHWEHRAGAAIGLRRNLSPSLVTEFPGQIDDKFFRMYCTFDFRYHRDQAYPADWITSNASAPLSVLLEIGGFDEEFAGEWGSEDIQLGCRMRDHGVTFELMREGGWVTHLGHARREPREDNKERIMKSLRGEYTVVANAGPLIAVH